jgi:hypothetical protein
VQEESRTFRITILAAERAIASRAVARGRFELEDIGAQACKQLAAVRSADTFGQFQDSYSSKGSGHPPDYRRRVRNRCRRAGGD